MNVPRTIRAMQASLAAATLVLSTAASAQTDAYKQLTSEWWQWALSIPIPDNPALDTTGEKCMVGQRGSNWFLAGVFVSEPVTRRCSIPDDVSLFFPVLNQVGFDTPNACGQGPEPIPAQEYRDQAAAVIDGALALSATLDGEQVANMRRVKSQVFNLSLPGDSLFAPFCEGAPGGLPAGVYSPAIDDGYYVRLNPLSPGSHTLKIHGDNGQGFVVDVTYLLSVVPVVRR